jgi:hypothetical protein
MFRLIPLLLALVLVLVSLITACRKRPAVSESALPAEPVYRIDGALTPGAQAKLLTHALITYEESYAGTPTDLNQLVEKRLVDRLPVPPPGKKFAIDSRKHEVVLVNQ